MTLPFTKKVGTIISVRHLLRNALGGACVTRGRVVVVSKTWIASQARNDGSGTKDGKLPLQTQNVS